MYLFSRRSEALSSRHNAVFTWEHVGNIGREGVQVISYSAWSQSSSSVTILLTAATPRIGADRLKSETSHCSRAPKIFLNPPIKFLFAIGLAPPGYALRETIGNTTGKCRHTPVGDGRVGESVSAGCRAVLPPAESATANFTNCDQWHEPTVWSRIWSA